MARRSNGLTSVVSGIDKRLKIVETSNVTSVPTGTYLAATAADEGVDPAPGVTAPNTPWTYRKIDSAYIYGTKATRGNGTRVELFLDLDDNNDNNLDFDLELGTSPINSAFIQISGLNGNSTTQYAASGTFRLTDYDVLAENPTRQTWRVTPPAGATHSLFYNPVIQGNETAAVELIAKRAIDSASATGSTVTIVFNSAHVFKVDDVIHTDLPAPFFGIDGLFKITEVVDSNTIRVELEQPVTSPQTYTWTSPNPRRYVYAVVHRYVEEGTVWIDQSVIPNKVYVWRGIRWYDTADPIGNVTAQQDGIAPSPVTNLAGVSEMVAGQESPVINLTWTPPTTRADGSSISGFLDGYDIWYKRAGDPVFKKELIKDGGSGISSHQIKDAVLVQNATYNIRVYTVDIMSQYSTAATVDVLTAKYSEVLNPPSKPMVSSRLGTITVTWDGLDSAGTLPVRGVIYVEYHRSTNSAFTPDETTLVGTTLPTLGGDYQVLADLDYGTTYYFKLVFVRKLSETELDKSAASVVSDGIQVAPLVNTDIIANTISGANIQSGTIVASDKIVSNSITAGQIAALTIEAGNIKANAIEADKIAAGAISAKILNGEVITASRADVPVARVELKNTGIFAYNSSNVPVFSFDIPSSTLQIGGYATSQNLTDGLGTKVSNGGSISDINSNFSPTGTSSVTTINGGAIRTGTIDAARITVTDIFRYKSEDVAVANYEVRIGRNAILGTTTNNAGISFFQKDPGNPSQQLQYGYLATWDTNKFELGTEFNNAYMTIGLGYNYRLQARFTNGYLFAGSLATYEAALSVTRDSTQAFFVGSTELQQNRAFLVDTSTRNVIVGNGSQWGTTNQSFDVWGRIRATGTITPSTSLSSARYKTDIRNFEVPDALFDISPKIFKYDNKIRYESWDSYPKNEPDFSEDVLGAIAEDFIEAGLGYLVSYDDQGRPEALDYSKIAVLLLPEIKALKEKVKILEDRIN